MSGHDFIDWPHETAHEVVIDCVRGGVEGHATANEGAAYSNAQANVSLHRSGLSCTHGSPGPRVESGIAAAGVESGPLTHSIAVQWTRWPLVDELRAKPARERRTGPRNNGSTR